MHNNVPNNNNNNNIQILERCQIKLRSNNRKYIAIKFKFNQTIKIPNQILVNSHMLTNNDKITNYLSYLFNSII